MSCKECNNTNQHKMSCSQRDESLGFMVPVPPRLSYLDFILDKLPGMSDNDINVLYYSVWREISVRENNSSTKNHNTLQKPLQDRMRAFNRCGNTMVALDG